MKTTKKLLDTLEMHDLKRMKIPLIESYAKEIAVEFYMDRVPKTGALKEYQRPMYEGWFDEWFKGRE